jgi:hypothetical protein
VSAAAGTRRWRRLVPPCRLRNKISSIKSGRDEKIEEKKNEKKKNEKERMRRKARVVGPAPAA